jgi:hypothetical protein
MSAESKLKRTRTDVRFAQTKINRALEEAIDAGHDGEIIDALSAVVVRLDAAELAVNTQIAGLGRLINVLKDRPA